jgi:hypothetical protein
MRRNPSFSCDNCGADLVVRAAGLPIFLLAGGALVVAYVLIFLGAVQGTAIYLLFGLIVLVVTPVEVCLAPLEERHPDEGELS